MDDLLRSCGGEASELQPPLATVLLLATCLLSSVSSSSSRVSRCLRIVWRNRRPHALHNVARPSAPLLHCTVSVALHTAHARRTPRGRLGPRLRRLRMAGAHWPMNASRAWAEAKSCSPWRRTRGALRLSKFVGEDVEDDAEESSTVGGDDGEEGVEDERR